MKMYVGVVLCDGVVVNLRAFRDREAAEFSFRLYTETMAGEGDEINVDEAGFSYCSAEGDDEYYIWETEIEG